MEALRRRWWVPVAIAYVTFILIGVSGGVVGVLLPAQIRDYDLDKATIGATFLTFSAGFMLAGSTSGALIHRFGIRAALATGGGAFVLAGLYTAVRPPFAALVAVQVVAGYGTGLMESALNTYLAALPGSTTLLNRLHAFFGVGALVGPPLATWMLGFSPWTAVWLVLALACLPLIAGFLLTLRGHTPATGEASGGRDAEHAGGGHTGGRARERTGTRAGGGLLAAASREPAVLLGAAFLAVYVGLEVSVGNWGVSFLMDERGQSDVLAGYIVSGYWLGLTLGRFLISPIAARLGMTATGTSFACMFGVTAATLLTWLAPGTLSSGVGFVLLGFCLGPLFPTTMAVAPRLGGPALVPTTIGLLNGVSVIGGAVFPWLAGAIAESAGLWTLPPYALSLAFLQLAIWWMVTNRLAPASTTP